MITVDALGVLDFHVVTRVTADTTLSTLGLSNYSMRIIAIAAYSIYTLYPHGKYIHFELDF